MKMWIFLLIWSSLMYNLNSQCDKKYSDITPDHSMCQPKNEECKFERKGYNQKNTLLRVHNNLRNNIKVFNGLFPLASNMLKMEWDDELYKIANHHVLRCIEQPDCSKCHQTGGTHVEQNFEVVSYSNNYSIDSPAGRFADVIKAWASEITGLRKSLSSKIFLKFRSSESPKKNWVNIYRATTYKVGCDSISYAVDNETYREIYVCNYTPATLTEGEEIYKIGIPCTSCPDGMGCDTVYKRLCAPIKTSSTSTTAAPTTTASPITTAAPITTASPITTAAVPNITAPASTAVSITFNNINADNLTTTTTTTTTITNTITTLQTTFINNKILRKCDFSIGTKKQCEFEMQCYKNWKTICGLEDCHQEIIIHEPKSSLLFITPISIEDQACLVFNYKKEYLSIAQDKSRLIAVAVWNEGENHAAVIIDDDANIWTMVSLLIPVRNQEIWIGFIVRKPNNSKGQKISIRNVYVLKGPC
ncbi:CRISP/Allergen/PR-1-like isoform X1 [Centruroides vittatus]|uniref:CRISP/Allergen/PR-1-like isoform X1 n=1 Tax=Centruroides vittatus TaxID=120091 RepID=UPI00350FBBF6